MSKKKQQHMKRLKRQQLGHKKELLEKEKMLMLEINKAEEELKKSESSNKEKIE